MLSEMFKAILITSLAGSVLAAVITLLKPVTKRVFSYSWHYYIWLTVLFVMILPVRFTLPQSSSDIPVMNTQTVQTAQTIETAQTDIADTPQTANTATITAAKKATDFISIILDNRMKYLSIIWLLGMAFMLMVNINGYIGLIIKIHKNSVVISCPKASNYTDRTITVRAGKNLSSPFMLGIFRPTLVLPDKELSAQQLNNILRHEMTHFKRKDILYKWFTLLVRSVHWFNPIMYYVAREINNECEISCDLSIVSRMNGDEQMSYINTILSLVSGERVKRQKLTTQMASGKRVLKRRFTMIKNVKKTSKLMSVVSAVVAVVMLGTTVFASGVLQNGLNDNSIKYEVYNGNKKISLSNQPFIYDGEYYLPLRETLNGFDVTDINYDNGSITIKLKESKIEGASNECVIKIGDIDIHYGTPKNYRIVMGAAPVLKDSITYVSTRFFESLIQNGNIIDFQLNVIRPTEPENYYTKDEKVFIGTASEQDSYNGELVKRIIVDENGETIAVVPVENQIADNIEQKFQRTEKAASYENYYECFYNSANGFYDANEELIYNTELNLIETLENPRIAYIAPADIIKIPENDFNKGLRQLITNTYKNETNNNLSVGTIIANSDDTVVTKSGNKISLEPFSDEEIAAARAVIEEYYRAGNAKDRSAQLATLTQWHHAPNVLLASDDKSIVKIRDIRYSPSDSRREAEDYIKYGGGSVNGAKLENVIVFYMDYDVSFPEGTSEKEKGAWMSSYDNWNMILIRDSKDGKWLIDDMGY